jgi:penicillin-binding protein 1A
VVPYGVQSITANGQPIAIPAFEEPQVIDSDLAAMMVRMMLAVVSRGTGRAASVRGDAVAGKTGTTQDERDAWFIGAVDGTVIGIWLGNDDSTPMHDVTGGSLPAELFHKIAVRLEDHPVRSKPTP